MAIPGDSHYTDRTRHFVQLGDGRTVSRAEAENIAAREKGFSGNYERRSIFREMKADPRHEKYQDAGEQRGHTRREIDDLHSRMIADYEHHGRAGRDKSHDGPLAQFLVAIGRRDARDTHDVGDTPSTK